MSTVPSSRPSQRRNQPPAERLPLRWVVIALLVMAAAGVGYLAAGIVTAIVTACAVATALHRIIA
ncbi:hypothetical protein JF770_15025 [Mycobacterium intracellulare]|uniref:hypothetical protein n=1 Tax=Mycobacterium intracellulare TaxID=1767 RepID=UPI001CD98841|nr:hypothetical protein [Mycobacterium intracellulare]MCA2304878.1 hypothetical protein [Mycobacterium intracellulare]MCA2347091.1 hypothetical protein [Mycobacterium intracellulare]